MAKKKVEPSNEEQKTDLLKRLDGIEKDGSPLHLMSENVERPEEAEGIEALDREFFEWEDDDPEQYIKIPCYNAKGSVFLDKLMAGDLWKDFPEVYGEMLEISIRIQDLKEQKDEEEKEEESLIFPVRSLLVFGFLIYANELQMSVDIYDIDKNPPDIKFIDEFVTKKTKEWGQQKFLRTGMLCSRAMQHLYAIRLYPLKGRAAGKKEKQK